VVFFIAISLQNMHVIHGYYRVGLLMSFHENYIVIV